MPKKIGLEPHLDVGQLERRYREAHDPVERSQYQMMWLIASGKATGEVMEATGYSRGWIQQVARRYNAGGPGVLGDGRHRNPGGVGRALLDEAGKAELRKALSREAPDGGVWTGRKVAGWLGERLGRRVGEQRGWDYLRRLGYTPKVPRPAHEQADPEERAAFPKG